MAGWFCLLKHRPIYRRLRGQSLVRVHMYLGCGLNPQSGHILEELIDVSHIDVSLSLSQINKHILG